MSENLFDDSCITVSANIFVQLFKFKVANAAFIYLCVPKTLKAIVD